VLDGDELVELSDWLWSSFHPGGRALTEEEKQAGVDKLLHRLDENGDGVMEFEAFRK
jgi:Ca2+-binding EF-hand superfamily protein